MSRLKAPSFDSSHDVLFNVEDHLLEQRRADLIERGEHLTLLCCGESGAGKTSLMNSLFAQKLTYANAGGPTLSLVESNTILSFTHTQLKIRLTTIDTPGYGDTLNLGDSFERVTDYITASFRRSIERERRPSRRALDRYDDRFAGGVDAVLYFISPHRLKEVDLVFMRRLSPLASIVPIIAKADTYTRDELRQFRELVSRRLHDEGIATVANPFAVICAETQNEYDETPDAPGRYYPWGAALSENDDVSDLPALRRFLVTDGLMKLHERRRALYETYRQNLALYNSQLVDSLAARIFKFSRSAVGTGFKAAVVVLAVALVTRRGGTGVPIATAAVLPKNGENGEERKNGGILGWIGRLGGGIRNVVFK